MILKIIGYYHNIPKGERKWIRTENNTSNGNSFPRNPGFHVMHWHEDLQFILVLDGTIEVQTLDTSVQICTREGLFVNKNVVHDVRRLEICHYNNFLFPAYFLEFYAGNPAKDFVDSVTSHDRMAFIHFTAALDWHKEVINNYILQFQTIVL